MKRILAIGVHPDDVELGAGGTLALHKSVGYEITIADLTKGELGTRGDAETRAMEAAAAAEILGAEERVNLGLSDGFIAEDENSLMKLIQVIRKFKPDIVLCNAIRDRHPDHGRGASFAARACFLSGLRRIETEMGGMQQAAWRPASVYHYIQDRFIHPDVVVDITAFFEKKMDSVKAFKSQFHNPDSNEPETPISSADYLHFLESRAREMGRLGGVKFGEGFTRETPVTVTDLFKLG